MSIGAADTEIPLVDASQFPDAGAVQIGDEVIPYSGKSDNVLLNAVRGPDAMAHGQGALVRFVPMTPAPTATATDTPTPTPTDTPGEATPTPTDTPAEATPTPTATPAEATPTPTATPAEATPTATDTPTEVPPSPTPT